MMINNYLSRSEQKLLEGSLLEAAEKARALLAPISLGIFVRKPLLDEDCPEVSDLDLISIWEKPEEMPERIAVQTELGRRFVDVLWIPSSKIFDAEEAASYKILPHLLLEYEDFWAKSNAVRDVVADIKVHAYDADVWATRICHQLSFGDAALAESRKNLGFPPAALFFLQTAHSYFAMALADSLKRSTMGLLTRPMTKIRHMASDSGSDVYGLMKTNLRVDGDPTDALVALRRVYDKVAAKCVGRQLRGTWMRARGHFDYSLSPLEFEYRELVANALMKLGDFANANFYIRFWAYSLSRCPVVLEEARQGRKPSFYVPFEPLKESVGATCPEILDDLKLILGGEITSKEVEASIRGTVAFRNIIRALIQNKGIKIL